MDRIDLAIVKMLSMTGTVSALPSVQRAVDRVAKEMLDDVDFTLATIDWTKIDSRECR